MKSAERKARLAALGYELERGAYLFMGRQYKYCRMPLAGSSGGSTCYFNDLKDVDRHIKELEQIREWQAGMSDIGTPESKAYANAMFDQYVKPYIKTPAKGE